MKKASFPKIPRSVSSQPYEDASRVPRSVHRPQTLKPSGTTYHRWWKGSHAVTSSNSHVRSVIRPYGHVFLASINPSTRASPTCVQIPWCFSVLASLCRVSRISMTFGSPTLTTSAWRLPYGQSPALKLLNWAELQAGIPGVTRKAPKSYSCRTEASIAQAKRHVANHRIVRLACQMWEAQISESVVSKGRGQALSSTEQRRFQRAFYNLWLLTYLPPVRMSVTKRLNESIVTYATPCDYFCLYRKMVL